MSIEKVRGYLKKFGAENRILEFSESSATVELASHAVGTAPEHIAKTMSFDVNGKTALVVCAGDMKIDNHKYKSYFHTKAKMLTPDEAVSRVGHAVGGVCPFALPQDVSVYLDVSLKRFETVYPACGSSNSAIGLSCDELELFSGAVDWVDVCAPRNI